MPSAHGPAPAQLPPDPVPGTWKAESAPPSLPGPLSASLGPGSAPGGHGLPLASLGGENDLSFVAPALLAATAMQVAIARSTYEIFGYL